MEFFKNLFMPAPKPSDDPRLAGLLEKWTPFFKNLPYPYVGFASSILTVRWNFKMRTRAGVCKPAQKLIELNPHLLKDDKNLEEVLLHEICHFAVGLRWPTAAPHGQKWKKLMNLCGVVPKRCHELVPMRRHSQKRWAYSCACRVHNVTTLISNRIKKGLRYKCKKCGSPLSLF